MTPINTVSPDSKYCGLLRCSGHPKRGECPASRDGWDA